MSEKISNRLLCEQLWQFSIDYYSRGTVERDCLALQNEYQGDVNLLLFLLWYSCKSGSLLSESQLKLILQAAAQEVENVMRLRKFRKAFEPQLKQSSMKLADQVKQQLLAIELTLEKQVQAALIDELSKPLELNELAASFSMSSQPEIKLAEPVLMHNLRLYLLRLQNPPGLSLLQLEERLMKSLFSE